MDEKVLKEEIDNLDSTLMLINKRLSELNNDTDNLQGDFNSSNSEYLEYLKTNANKMNEEDIIQIANMQGRLTDIEEVSEDINKQINAYNKMLDKPYFARVDINEKGLRDVENYYIGIHSLVGDNKEYRVVDWRSPIASIFYDYEKGDCQIKTKSSVLNCNLINKRQYGISGGKLNYYIDTTINIEDDILKEALAKNTSNQMKSIVQTIQKEQNRIIRGDEHKTLIVQGIAGSGKTAIALHRIAYLLYKLKGKIKSENIHFISPNDAFSSYISSVLPDLAEDDIEKFQLDNIARKHLKKHCILEKRYEQVERLIIKQDLQEYSYKTSYQFLQDLLLYANEHYVKNFHIDNLVVKDTIIDVDKIQELFFGRYGDRDIFTRFKWITDNIYDMYFYKIKSVERMIRIKEYIFRKLYDSIQDKNCVKAYINFLKSKNLKIELVGDKVKNEDAYGILFFKMFIFGLDKFSNVRHLVIDEMQDYSALQMYIINYLYDCPKTILGDYNQTLCPSDSIRLYQNLDNVFNGDLEKVSLYKSYRSTEQIAQFGNLIGDKRDVQVVSRQGESVDLICIEKEDCVDSLINLINRYKDKGYCSIAIITKSNMDAVRLHKLIKKYIPNINLIDDNFDKYDNKECVISVYNSKGLEFDGVIVYDVSNNYCTDIDTNLLYIASTRALHKLTILSVNKPSLLLNKYKENMK